MGDIRDTPNEPHRSLVLGGLSGVVTFVVSIAIYGVVMLLVSGPFGPLADYFGSSFSMIPMNLFWPIIATLVGVFFGALLANKLFRNASSITALVVFSILPVVGLIGLGLGAINSNEFGDPTPYLNAIFSLIGGWMFLFKRV